MYGREKRDCEGEFMTKRRGHHTGLTGQYEVGNKGRDHKGGLAGLAADLP